MKNESRRVGNPSRREENPPGGQRGLEPETNWINYRRVGCITCDWFRDLRKQWVQSIYTFGTAQSG
jgi:hypothetical protein